MTDRFYLYAHRADLPWTVRITFTAPPRCQPYAQPRLHRAEFYDPDIRWARDAGRVVTAWARNWLAGHEALAYDIATAERRRARQRTKRHRCLSIIQRPRHLAGFEGIAAI